ncbi:Glycosyltransferase Gtf1 [bioreactor metagenome]|uniref:Glycosyltransferase Gtf1 n=1 Tax=bioreactor metagenome TaxID=1076179 RepID=A0A645DC98_9ZZZZ
MLEAFSRFLRNRPDSMFVYVGDGEDREKLESFICGKQLAGKVLLTGRQSAAETALYLNAADLFVMGSELEGWSTTLVEACACGIPSVVTAFSSSEDMIQDGVNGYVVRDRDPERFAEMMAAALLINREQCTLHNRRYAALAVAQLRQHLLQAISI